MHDDLRRSFSFGAGLSEFLPKGAHVLIVTSVHGLREGASVQDRVHHAGKAWRVGVTKPGDEHAGLPVGRHDLM